MSKNLNCIGALSFYDSKKSIEEVFSYWYEEALWFSISKRRYGSFLKSESEQKNRVFMEWIMFEKVVPVNIEERRKERSFLRFFPYFFWNRPRILDAQNFDLLGKVFLFLSVFSCCFFVSFVVKTCFFLLNLEYAGCFKSVSSFTLIWLFLNCFTDFQDFRDLCLFLCFYFIHCSLNWSPIFQTFYILQILFNCSQAKFMAIILVLLVFFAIFRLTDFLSDSFDFLSSKTG